VSGTRPSGKSRCKKCGRPLKNGHCPKRETLGHMTPEQLERKRARGRKANRAYHARHPKRRRESNRRYNASPKRRAWEAKRRAEGKCVKCGQPRLSETMCWDCLNRKQSYREVGNSDFPPEPAVKLRPLSEQED
jgi:hypothetical protein